MKAKRKKESMVKAPKAGKKLSAGPKLKGFLGVTRKKSEPDNPILARQSSPLGKPAPNPGAKASASKARLSRLKDVRI